MATKKGFTLIELMVVMLIIAIVASILFPVLSRAKRRATRTVATSNLRQCFIAFTLYHDDSSDSGDIAWNTLPSTDKTWEVLGSDVTRDPLDNWRRSNEKSPYEALVGSFVYIGSKSCISAQRLPVVCGFDSQRRAIPLFMSFFESDERVMPGDYTFGVDPSAKMPRKSLSIWNDGHVKSANVIGDADSKTLFTWGSFIQRVTLSGGKG